MIVDAALPASVGTGAIAAICTFAFVAGIARGFSGFGAALIFMPLASSVAAPRLVAAVLLLIDLVAATPMLPNAWRQADRRAVAIMAIGAAVGTPLGAYALSRFDAITTRWIITAFVSALLALLISGWRYRGKDHTSIAVGIGGLSGFCAGLAQAGGPPVVAYWLGRPTSPGSVRANIILFFAASSLFSLASYLVGGLITADAAKIAMMAGAPYAIGILLGVAMFGKASETVFRVTCYGLIALAAVIGMPLMDYVLR